MGYSIDLFLDQSHINPEFVCPICHDVLEDVAMLDSCEHVFCRSCISNWYPQSRTCPVDRVLIRGFKAVQRVFLNVLNSLRLRCPHGCETEMRLGEVKDHEERCDLNPENHKECVHGCGCVLKLCEIKHHSCLAYLKQQLREARSQLDEYKSKYGELPSPSMETESNASAQGGTAQQGPSSSTNGNGTVNHRKRTVEEVSGNLERHPDPAALPSPSSRRPGPRSRTYRLWLDRLGNFENDREVPESLETSPNSRGGPVSSTPQHSFNPSDINTISPPPPTLYRMPTPTPPVQIQFQSPQSPDPDSESDRSLSPDVVMLGEQRSNSSNIQMRSIFSPRLRLSPPPLSPRSYHTLSQTIFTPLTRPIANRRSPSSSPEPPVLVPIPNPVSERHRLPISCTHRRNVSEEVCDQITKYVAEEVYAQYPVSYDEKEALKRKIQAKMQQIHPRPFRDVGPYDASDRVWSVQVRASHDMIQPLPPLQLSRLDLTVEDIKVIIYC